MQSIIEELQQARQRIAELEARLGSEKQYSHLSKVLGTPSNIALAQICEHAIAKMGGWELDARTLEVTWTEQTCAIHELPPGYKPDLLEAINYYHPEDRAKVSDSVHAALEHGTLYDIEVRLITANGRRRWTRTIGKPEYQDGQVIKLVGAFEDITERKANEEALKRSEKRLKDAQSVGGLGDWDWEPATDAITWSENLYHILGLPPDYPVPHYQEQLALYHPEDAQKLHEAAMRALEDGSPFELELRRTNPDGCKKHLLIKGICGQVQDGKTLRLYGSLLDITKLRAAEAAQWESEQRFSLAFHKSHAAMALVTPDGRFQDINERLFTLCGYTREELLSEAILLLTPAEDRELAQRRYQQYIADGLDGYECEKRLLTKDGQIYRGLLTVSRVTDAAGDLLYSLFQFLDLTPLQETYQEPMPQTGNPMELSSPIPAADQYSASQVPLETPTQGQPNSRVLRTLVVEDDSISSKVLAALLGKWGHTVVTACNGREALNKLTDHTFDVVVMDVQMPEMDGIEATLAIRANKSNRLDSSIPIIGVTGHAPKGYREKCLAACMDDFLPKPIEADSLQKALERVIAKRDRRQGKRP
jgi:PAS domain S-box-containing protein